jgi:hypothetical protein
VHRRTGRAHSFVYTRCRSRARTPPAQTESGSAPSHPPPAQYQQADATTYYAATDAPVDVSVEAVALNGETTTSAAGAASLPLPPPVATLPVVTSDFHYPVARSDVSNLSPTTTCGLYLGNLAWSVTDAELSDFFCPIGEVTCIRILFDKLNGKSKGFAYVEYARPEDAVTALNVLGNESIHGRQVILAPTTFLGIMRVHGTYKQMPPARKSVRPNGDGSEYEAEQFASHNTNVRGGNAGGNAPGAHPQAHRGMMPPPMMHMPMGGMPGMPGMGMPMGLIGGMGMPMGMPNMGMPMGGMPQMNAPIGGGALPGADLSLGSGGKADSSPRSNALPGSNVSSSPPLLSGGPNGMLRVGMPGVPPVNNMHMGGMNMMNGMGGMMPGMMNGMGFNPMMNPMMNAMGMNRGGPNGINPMMNMNGMNSGMNNNLMHMQGGGGNFNLMQGGGGGGGGGPNQMGQGRGGNQGGGRGGQSSEEAVTLRQCASRVCTAQ